MAKDDVSPTKQIRRSKSSLSVELDVASELLEQTAGPVEEPEPEVTPGRPESSDSRARRGRTKPSSYRRVERRFGRYELLMDLESGGMATLYLARLTGPEHFEKLVAIKIIHPHLTKEQNFVRMFHDEARISALLYHPNIVQIYDLGSVDDSYFIAMEYVRGKDYHDILWESKLHAEVGTVPLPVANHLYAARVAADAAAGLHAAHELRSAWGEPLGLVHRDVSPHNILISYDGHVKLTDFGIAYAKHRVSSTASGVLKGKTAYMAPEQALGGAIDRRSDVFALGVVLWEAVTRKRLFRRETDTATLHALTHDKVPHPREVCEDVPEELDRIVMRALQWEPSDRYQTAEEMQRALEQFISDNGAVIGATELKVMMEVLFEAHKARLEEQITNRLERTNALHATDQTLPSGSYRKGTKETRLSAQAHRSITVQTGGRSLGWNLLMVALLLAIGAGGYFLIRDSRRESRTPTEEPTPAMAPPPRRGGAAQPDAAVRRRPARPRPAAPQKLVITFVVKPARARPTIHFRGKRYPQKRIDLLVPVGEKTEQVRVEAPGYHPTTLYVLVRPEAKLKHEIVLRPRHRRTSGRPTPRPMDMQTTPRPVDIGLDD